MPGSRRKKKQQQDPFSPKNLRALGLEYYIGFIPRPEPTKEKLSPIMEEMPQSTKPCYHYPEVFALLAARLNRKKKLEAEQNTLAKFITDLYPEGDAPHASLSSSDSLNQFRFFRSNELDGQKQSDRLLNISFDALGLTDACASRNVV